MLIETMMIETRSILPIEKLNAIQVVTALC